MPSRGDGWTVEDRDTVLYYADRSGHPAVGVAGPAVYRDGYCARERRSDRGFVGFTRATPGAGARRANVHLMRDWLAAVALDGRRRTPDQHTPVRTRAVSLADGGAAVRSTSRVTVAHPGPCGSPGVELTLLSFEAGGAVATLVLVRDVGAPGTLGDVAADRILATARPVGE